MLRNRRTILSETQRLALDAARKLLATADFGGQSVRIYVPCRDRIVARQDRIVQAIRSGAPSADIARAEGVTLRHVQSLRGRLCEKTRP